MRAPICAYGNPAAKTFVVPLIDDKTVDGSHTVNLVPSHSGGGALGPWVLLSLLGLGLRRAVKRRDRS